MAYDILVFKIENTGKNIAYIFPPLAFEVIYSGVYTEYQNVSF